MSYFSPVELGLLAFSLPRHVSKVSQMMAAFEKRTGKRTRVVSGTRSTALQAQIHADSLAAGGYKGQQTFRAAPAGQSKHEAGAATDINIIDNTTGDAAKDAASPLYRALAEEGEKVGLKAGLNFKTGLPDPYHFEEPEPLATLKAEFQEHIRDLTTKGAGLLAVVAVLLLLWPVVRRSLSL